MMAKKKELTKQDIIESIKENYENLEQSIVNQLMLETPRHHSTTGVYREKIWESLFRQIIPHKFSIAQGVFIIDSSDKTNISKEVDLVVFDEQYTPYIFNYGNIKFIPIEAVAIVIQCKSENITKSKLESWVSSIVCLNTSPSSIARIATHVAMGSAPTQKATQPIKILCSLKSCVDNRSEEPKYGFDIAISSQDKKLKVTFSKKIDTLYKAYKTFNDKDSSIEVYDYEQNLDQEILDIKNKFVDANSIQRHFFEDDIKRLEKHKKEAKDLDAKKINDFKVGERNSKSSILSLIFQLNQLLMLINNPMLFPHQAYVEMFNKQDGA